MSATSPFSPYNVNGNLTAARVVAEVNIAGAYFNGPSNNGVGATITGTASTLTIDSVVVNNGDRILLQAQSLANENGIYDAAISGVNFVLTRADDFQCAEQVREGFYIFIGAGTVNGGSCFVVVEPLPQTFGIDPLVIEGALGAGLGTASTKAASAAGQPTVASVSGATVLNNFAKFADTAGTVEDAGGRIIANTTAAYGGGGTSNAFTATGLTATCHGTAVIRASTNSVSINKALPGTNTLTITFSADPGAGTTVDYIYATAPLA